MSKNSSPKYYQDKKERLQKKLVRNTKVSPKKKKKNQQYWCERYKNFSGYEK